MKAARPAGTYGIDAPWVPWLWVALSALYLVFTALAVTAWQAGWPTAAVLFLIALLFAAGASLYWYATLRGKFLVWRGLLDEVRSVGAMRVLDVGCGRGAVAILTALHAPAATITGIDLWRSIDQSGNGPEASRSNAAANGVADRIAFETGDMTALPFGDGDFDLVTASLSIHNVPSPEGRERAVREAWRVLAAGGTLVIADIRRTAEYAAVLTEVAGAAPLRRPVGWRMWWTGPWLPTTVLITTKPAP